MSTPENPNKNNNSHENEGAQVPNLEKALGSIYAGFSDEEKEKLAQKVANSEDVRKTLASMEAADLGALIAESPESAEQYKDIVNGILRSADVVKAPGTDVEVTKSKELVRPADFDQFDYDDAVATAATYATKPKWDLGWTKGVSLRNNVTTNWDRFHEARKDRRNYRLANKTKDMTPEERAAYMEKYDKRRRRVLKLGAYAIPIAIGAYGIFKIYQATKGVETATHGGGSVDHGQMAHNGDFRAAEEASYGPDREWFDYNNSDSSFYDFDHKAFHGDFGPALQASEKDGSMGPGFADWMSRHKHDPNGLANVISGLGLEGHDGSLTDRNELGDFLNGNIHEQMRLDKLLDESLRDPTKFKIETVDLGTYDTTYEVDNNGDPMIATQRNVSHGGTAFKVTNVATGEETFFRKECGGDQQVWPVHTEQVGYQPTESHPGTPETPTTPTTPVTPETPITPEQPTGPQPPVNTPKNPLEDINVNPGLPEQNQMGDVRVGSGAPQAEQDVVTPSPNYSPGATGHNDDSVAPGAAPNASPRDNLPPQQAGSSTGTGQAGNGAGAGATTESVGEN